MKKCLAFVFISLVCYSVFAQEKVIKLASLDWEPYIGKSIPNNGYVAQIAVEAFKTQGYKVEIDYLPWARAVDESKLGSYDGLFPEYMDETRKPDFVYSDSFKGGPVGFMKRKDKKIATTKLEDLKSFTIGTVRGYVNTTEFDNAKFLKKEEAVDDETNIKKLNANRIDLIVIDKYVGMSIIAKKFPTYRAEMEFMEPALEEKPLYICFSKKAPNYQEKLQAFNSGLKEITKNGTLAKILKEFEE